MADSDLRAAEAQPPGLVFRGNRQAFIAYSAALDALPINTVTWVIGTRTRTLVSQWVQRDDSFENLANLASTLANMANDNDVIIEVRGLGPWRALVADEAFGLRPRLQVTIRPEAFEYLSFDEAVPQLFGQLRSLRRAYLRGNLAPTADEWGRAERLALTQGTFEIGPYNIKIIGSQFDGRTSQDRRRSRPKPTSTGRTDRFHTVALDAFIWTDRTAEEGIAMREALLGLLREYETIAVEIGPEQDGSWFQSMRIKLRAAAGSEDGRRLARQVQLRLENELIMKSQAEIDHTKATSAATLMTAIGAVDNAVIILGQLIVIKTAGSVFVRSVDPDVAAKVESNPALFKNPESILALISTLSRQRRELEL